MYTAIKGTYENGKVILEETPPTQLKTKVLVMFLADEEKTPEALHKGVKLGSIADTGFWSRCLIKKILFMPWLISG